MILGVQGVTDAKVVVNGETIGEINAGAMVLCCAEAHDTADAYPLAQKFLKLRIFSDDQDRMNIGLLDLPDHNLLLVPQFTLAADCRKGNRPSFQNAAPPALGLEIFNGFKAECEKLLGRPVQQGEFGADMKVSLCNDGPATFILKS